MKNLIRIPDFDRKKEEKPKFKLAVVGSGKGVGTSYVASYVLSNGLIGENTPEGLRTLVELGTPHFYVALGMDKRFAGREFFYYESKSKFSVNMEMGYNWYLKRPERVSFDEGSCFRALYGAIGSFIVFDCSGITDIDILQSVLSEMDMIYLVVDPLPTKLLPASSFIEKMQILYPDMHIIVNKYNKGIHKGELKRFLGSGKYDILPAIPAEEIYRAEYNCVLPKVTQNS